MLNRSIDDDYRQVALIKQLLAVVATVCNIKHNQLIYGRGILHQCE